MADRRRQIEEARQPWRWPGCSSAIEVRALVNGVATGTGITTAAGHRYVLTTRIYAAEFSRRRETFRSSTAVRGGEPVASDMRLVLEVHDINPADPGSEAAVSALLYDEVLSDVPPFCTYAPVNAIALQAAIAFTRLARDIAAEVRSAFPGQPYKTRLVGYISEGGECRVFDTPELHFHAEHVPAANEKITVCYRGSDQAASRVKDAASIEAQQADGDDGVRATARNLTAPPARTSADCDNAALALLDDANAAACSGTYATWSDFIGDVLPGDAVAVSVPSQAADFTAIVREVSVEIADPLNDRSRYELRFANDTADPLSLALDPSRATPPDLAVDSAAVGAAFLVDLPYAEITAYSSIDVTLDAGRDPAPGGGIEVRRSDWGWGPEGDRNLIGRFAARTFTITRLSRSQDCYLRQYDGQGRYSRYSTALHLDCPL